jgi:hypothetical protein
MEKINVLQERIEERSAEKFNKDFMSLIRIINENPIGKKLKIKINEKESFSLINYYGTTGGTFFNSRYEDITKYGNDLTNIEEIKNELIEKYIKEETDSILGKIEVLADFLENKE